MVSFFKTRFVTVVLPLPDQIFFGEVRQGKYRKAEYFERGEKSLEEIFGEAKTHGFGPDLALAASFEDFRMETVRYPDMTETELEEAIAWETDHIFRTEQELSTAWEAVSHSSEGYETVVTSCRADTILWWAEAARKACCRLAWVIPLPSLFGKSGKEIFALAGKEESWLYLMEAGRPLEKKRVHFAEREEKFSAFLEGREDTPVSCLPAEGCDAETYAEWEASLGISPEEMERKEMHLLVGAMLAGAICGMNLARREDRARPFLGKEDWLIRGLQGACILGVIVVAVLGVQFWRVERLLAEEENKAEKLFAVKETMRQEEIHRAEWESERAEGKEFLSRARLDEGAWILLADVFPDGVLLQSIEHNGPEIVLHGCSESMDQVFLLQKNLTQAWNAACREEISPSGNGPSLRFSLYCRMREHGKDGK